MDNNKNFNFIIGQNIKRLRKEKNLTQKELADLLNAKGRKTWNVSVSRYESGKTAVSYDLIVDIASVLGCSVDEITGHVDKGKTAVLMAKALRSVAEIIEQDKSVID